MRTEDCPGATSGSCRISPRVQVLRLWVWLTSRWGRGCLNTENEVCSRRLRKRRCAEADAADTSGSGHGKEPQLVSAGRGFFGRNAQRLLIGSGPRACNGEADVMSALNTGSAKTQSTRCRHSLITSIADLRERCDIDPVTRCWNWLGGYNGYNNRSLIPRLWVYDYDRHDKASVSGPRAAWMLAHEAAPLPGYVVYRACGNRRCLNPVHLRDGRKSDVGANARLSGRLKARLLNRGALTCASPTPRPASRRHRRTWCARSAPRPAT